MKLSTDPRLPIFGGNGYDKALYQRLYDIFRELSASVNSDKDDIAAIAEAVAHAPWYGKAVGEVFELRDDLAAGLSPPTGNANFRFIKLTASDAYNAGALTGETLSGSAPNVVATAIVSLAGSPLNGKTVYLENTMRTFGRAGSSGALQAAQVGPHTHSLPIAFGAAGGTRVIGTWADSFTQNNGAMFTNSNGTTDNNPRNIGRTLYMRVK